ncbi:DUF1281 domain-containing protein [Proteus mirabilis]|uniref:DUF1281 domain-containing protein n=1 Tax=Proteus mirabilis TaxID=584 RepID=UPI001F5D4162|nr:DUF1281 domain-containing protein [Proteus mirabilis]
MDMRTLLPTSLAAELHGFNGRLWKTPEVIWRQARWQAFAPVTDISPLSVSLWCEMAERQWFSLY